MLDAKSGDEVFGCLDGDNLEKYKFGHESGAVDSKIMINFLKKIVPTKMPELECVNPCIYAYSKSNEFIFERQGNVILACGLEGRGFKFGPYHGKRVLNFVKGNDLEANKYRAKL